MIFRVRRILILGAVGFILSPHPSFGQDPEESAAPPASAAGSLPQTQATPPGGKRILGVLPNYRTVDPAQVTGPLTASEKFAIASKDSFDYPLVFLAAGLAGIGQWANQNPSFGQEMGGFTKRMVTGFADQSLGNIMTEGLFPSMLHEDPRYYRKGTGTTFSRTAYAFSRLFVTNTDSGAWRFNYSEWGGNAAATAISNIYYPDGRTVSSNLEKLGLQIGLDGLALVMKEFWPDVKQKVFEHKPSPGATH